MLILTDLGPGEIAVIILDEDGKETSNVELKKLAGNQTECVYTPKNSGLHSVNVFYEQKTVEGSPFGVKIKPS